MKCLLILAVITLASAILERVEQREHHSTHRVAERCENGQNLERKTTSHYQPGKLEEERKTTRLPSTKTEGSAHTMPNTRSTGRRVPRSADQEASMLAMEPESERKTTPRQEEGPAGERTRIPPHHMTCLETLFQHATPSPGERSPPKLPEHCKHVIHKMKQHFGHNCESTTPSM